MKDLKLERRGLSKKNDTSARNGSDSDKASKVTEKRSKHKHDQVIKGNIEKPQGILLLKGSKVVVEMEKTQSKKRQLADEDDSDFEIRPGPSKKQKGKETKRQIVDTNVKKGKKVIVMKEFPSRKNRCSPVALLAIIQGLSREQKECVRSMGFGSLLRLKLMDVPLKLGFYVLEHFNVESLKVKVANGELDVNSKSVKDMLGLPFGGTLLSEFDFINENDEESCMFEWKEQFEKFQDLRLKQLKNEILRTRDADYNFKINFLVLFINTFCESTSMGKCNLNPLYFIRRETDISKIDWCNYLVDCLIRTKKLYNPEKESSFFFGPAAYLVLLYVDSVKFDLLQVTRRHPTICYWSSEKIRFREDVEQEEGGFGCGEINEAYIEELQESSEDEEESDGDQDLTME